MLTLSFRECWSQYREIADVRDKFPSVFFLIFTWCPLMFLPSDTGHLFTAHSLALLISAFTTTNEPSCWTVTAAVPAAWSPLLTVHVQTSSPAALEHARHEVSHYFLFPASSSSWRTPLHLSLRCQMSLCKASRNNLLVSSSASAPCQTCTPQFPFFTWQALWDTDSISFSSEISVR